MVRININEFVKVKLTPEGERIRRVKADIERDKNCYGEYRFQLWELMMIFGPFMGVGSKQFFEENTLVIGDANEHV